MHHKNSEMLKQTLKRYVQKEVPFLAFFPPSFQGGKRIQHARLWKAPKNLLASFRLWLCRLFFSRWPDFKAFHFPSVPSLSSHPTSTLIFPYTFLWEQRPSANVPWARFKWNRTESSSEHFLPVSAFWGMRSYLSGCCSWLGLIRSPRMAWNLLCSLDWPQICNPSVSCFQVCWDFWCVLQLS